MPTNTEHRRFYTLSFFSNLSADLAIWSFYFLSYCKFSLAEATALHGFIFGVIALGDLPTSTWADRFGRKRTYQVGLICRLIGALLSITTLTLIGIAVAALFTGLGWALSSGTLEALVFDNLKATGQEEAFPTIFSNSISFQFLGRILAFGASGFLFELHPTYPYLLLAAAMIISLLILQSIPEKPYQETTARHLRHQTFEAIVFIMERRPLLIFIACLTLLQIGADGLSWIPLQPILTDHGLIPSKVGLAYAVGALGSFLGSQLAKKTLSGKQTRGYLLYTVLFVAGNMGLACLSQEWYLFISFFVLSVAFGLSWPLRSSILNVIIPSSHRATCLSIASSLDYLAVWFVGSSVGRFIEVYGAMWPPLLASVITILTLPLLLYVLPILLKELLVKKL